MAITTKTTETLQSITYGLSDSLDVLYSGGNLTPSELARFSWCRWEDKYLDCVAVTDINVGSQQGAAVFTQLSYFQNVGDSYLDTKYVSDRIATCKPYCFNILLRGRNDAQCITSVNASDYKVVTSCSDFQSLYIKVDEYDEGTDFSVEFPTARTVKLNNLSWVTDGVYNSNTDTETDYIKVWTVLVIDETHFFITKGMAFPGRTPCLYDGSLGAAQKNLRPSNRIELSRYPTNNKWYYEYGDIKDYNEDYHLLRWYSNNIVISEEITWDDNITKSACWDVDTNVSVFMRGYWGNYNYTYYLRTENAVKDEIAYAGLRWKYVNGDTTHTYTPIIADGYITGWSTDPDVETELNDVDDVTGNNINPYPPAPPTPGTDDDNDDPVSTAGAPYAKGLVNYYAMTAGSTLIDHISEALSTWDLQNTGKDLYKNLVSCKLIKPPAAIPTTGSEPFTIYGEKPQYQGADITLPVVSGNPDASFGPYSISRKFNDFRDYAPYTRVDIFLPYCGWCNLPSHVIGRSVTVKYFTDIIAATVRAVVFCGNNIVAEAAGVMGLDIPFTADAVGMKQAGVVSGLTAYAGGALQTAAGVASIVTTKGGKGIGETLSGASKLVSAYTQTAIAFNENTTEISGKNGDGCCLSGATNIIIKIIRPKYGASSSPPYVPAGFAHSVGFVSNKQVRVGNVSGLLIADNVDTSGIAGATDAERAEIKRVLETGLIVNAAPE